MIRKNSVLSLLLLLHTGESFLRCSLYRERSDKKIFESYIYRKGENNVFRYRRIYSPLIPLSATNLNVDNWYMLAIASTSAAVGMQMEKSRIGKSLSAPVCAMLVGAVLTNLNVIPPSVPFLSQLTTFIVKLATPLLLFGADLNKIFKETGDLMKAFILGTISTVIGSLISFAVLLPQLSSIGSNPHDGWGIISALTSKNIGGGINFMAVVEGLKVSPQTISTGLAVDNLIGLLYFPTISWIADRFIKSPPKEILSRSMEEPKEVDVEHRLGEPSNFYPSASLDDVDVDSSQRIIERFSTAFSLSCIIVSLSEYLGALLSYSSLSISTLLTVAIATTFPDVIKPIVPIGDILGRVLLLLFFGSIGNSAGKISTIFTNSDTVVILQFTCMLYAVHMLVLFGVGSKVFKMPLQDLVIASNANIGNAATATAFASAKGWNNKLLPAMLVGTFGNSIATVVGLTLGELVFKQILIR